MISFEQVLERAGFDLAPNILSEGQDTRDSFWQQKDGDARASIFYGGMAASGLTVLEVRIPTLIVNISPDSKTAVYVGTWDNPVLAAMELPQRLKQVYQEILK